MLNRSPVLMLLALGTVGCLGNAPVDENREALGVVYQPPVVIVAPDYEIELDLCDNTLTAALSDQLYQAALALQDPTQNPASSLFQSAIGYAWCDGATTRGGIWRNYISPQDALASLRQTEILSGGHQYAVQVGGAMIRSVIDASWNALNKRPSDALTLNDHHFDMTGPQQTTLEIDGSYMLLGLGYAVHAYYTDTMAIIPTTDPNHQDGSYMVSCTSQHSLDGPQAVMALASFFLPVIGPFLSVFIASADSPSLPNVGPLCQIVSPFFPRKAFGPGPEELVFDYDGVTVSPSGVLATGTLMVRARKPICLVGGEQVISLASASTTSVSASYELISDEMRGPLTYSWTASDATVLAPTASPTTIVFRDFSGSPSVIVHATDADGLTCSGGLYGISFEKPQPTVNKILGYR
jgi:hypothetical protein